MIETEKYIVKTSLLNKTERHEQKINKTIKYYSLKIKYFLHKIVYKINIRTKLLINYFHSVE